MLLVNHGRPERLARLRRIRSVENATDEVASVMEEALDQLLATGQNLDALEDKSEQLLAQATAFQRKSRGIRFRFCCRNLKLTCCIGSLVSLVIALVTLLVLQYTGVIHLWPTGCLCTIPRLDTIYISGLTMAAAIDSVGSRTHP